MRVPKYQAWHKTERRMFDVFGMEWSWSAAKQGDEWYELTLFSQDGVPTGRRVLGNDTIQNNYELREFTGLKGRNGKEIYESDIVKGTNGIGYVKYEYGGYRVQMQECWIQLSEDIFEVIGNIYENKDLLEEGIPAWK